MRLGRSAGPIALVALFVPGPARAAALSSATTTSQAIATLEAGGGDVLIIRLGESLLPTSPMRLQLDDVIVTKRGRATVRFDSDGTVLRIGPDSRVQVNETAKERDIQVFFGKLWAHVVRWKERPTRFRSSSTIAAMRGTELSFAVDGDQTQLAVLEGRVLAENGAGSLLLTGGQVAVVQKGNAPALKVDVRPRDAVRWALYYLPVLQVRRDEVGGEAPWQALFRESTEAGGQGHLKQAIDVLEDVAAADVSDPRFFTYRASLLLAAGNVQEAGKDLERAFDLAPRDSEALALTAIIAVARNETDQALDAAQRAVAADPRSASAQVALSYAYQARFDLEGAKKSLESAIRLDPKNGLAWARLAEIRSSFADLGGALEAARKAIDLEPNLARTQTVLGFAYLTEVHTTEAQEAFHKAVEFDPSDPLPRLGLGLAEIREGRLASGTRELEIAISLDPGQAVVRSYLGKAYYEAKRTALVEREYDVAKQSDPKDPTPWFYDAIAKQAANGPVEALLSLQEAIALNDNRAVYRSRLLLDSDLAARSASLGRVYADLGFEDLALVEGWNSVNTDPTSYSAHRLLADSYQTQPRHEIARVSELFQSQMLQPLNTTPIQPSLGEGSLLLLGSQGPSALGFNEFNPLFARNQVNVQGSFLLGQDGTRSGEGIAAGIYDKASFSVGYSRFKTDGFRANDLQDDKIANAFAQVELNPSTSVQAEVRHRELQAGDLGLYFFADDFSPFQAQMTKFTNERIGLRHEFGESLIFLASYMHQGKDIGFSLPNPVQGVNFGIDRTENANSVEGQLLFRSPSLRAIGGIGHFRIHTLESDDLGGPALGGIDSVTTSDTNIHHTNLYLYSHVSLPKSVTLTLGLSGDLFDESGTSLVNTLIPGVPAGPPSPAPAAVLGTRNQANPKVGITWSSKSGTTLRAAGFRVQKRTLVTDATLEPTQVAGFNQFYDDPSATRSWVYGAALDQKFSKKWFGGVEATRRDLTIPQTLVDNSGNLSLAQRGSNERLGRAYLFAALRRDLTLSAEYAYEEIGLDPQLFLQYRKAKTQRVPLSARYFHPSGISASLVATYLNQHGNFQPPDQSGYLPGQRDFWVLDAVLRYRFPRRYGIVMAGVRNLTDQRSTYQATDSANLQSIPGRVVFVRAVLAFP
jgi:tetratricopeptide (TPR) repeat protein